MPRSELPLRPCVGVMVLHPDGRVWMGHRPRKERDELPEATDRRWQMPQGGIDDGEDPLRAARRELWEETGIETVTLLDRTEDWLAYELPPELVGVALKGKYRGQRQLWFVFRFDGSENEINIAEPPDGSHPEFDRWEWVPVERIAERIVAFKEPIYRELIRRFAHHAAPSAA